MTTESKRGRGRKMAKSPEDTISGRNGNDAASVSMADSSENSPQRDRLPRSKESKLTDGDLIDIFQSDLNRLKERFGTVTLANTSTGKACIVLPVELGWCIRCNNIMLRHDSNLCERHREVAIEDGGGISENTSG